MSKLDELIEKVEQRYNPEYDIPPGPIVTITDMQLLECIKLLQSQVIHLEAKIANHVLAYHDGEQ